MAALRPPFISPVAPETKLSAAFDAWGDHWEPKATSGPHKGKGQHKGLDFEVPVGTPVRAIADGVVREVSSTIRGGLYLWLGHGGGYHSGYHHLSEVYASAASAKAGQTVTAGDVVCLSGDSGTNTTGPHLHLTVRGPGPAADNRIDPRPFAATPFADIGPEHYGYDAACWAKDPLGNKGPALVAGQGGELPREAPVTRIWLLTVLWRFWGLLRK